MNKKDCIIIVTNMFDPHADVVIRKLASQSENVIRLNTDYIPHDSSLRLSIQNDNEDFELKILKNGRVISSNDIKSIWWRRPEIFDSSFLKNDDQRRFFEREMSSIWRGIWTGLNTFWVSHPNNIAVAEIKLGQLRIAKELGFTIPATIFTNLRGEVEGFSSKHPQGIVYKVVRDNFLGIPHKGVYDTKDSQEFKIARTVEVTSEDIQSLPKKDVIWSQFQEKLQKRYEYRVTVIGSRVFSVRIDSQSDEQSKIDWRNNQAGLDYYLCQLPLDIEEKCQALVDYYNLNYGAIDLVETVDGEFVFLEINASGQYMWLEKHLNTSEMTDHLCEILIAGRRL